MTDRVKGFTVALEKDIRTDDVEPIIQAILLMRGVASVTSELVDASDWINRTQVKHELARKIVEHLQ